MNRGTVQADGAEIRQAGWVPTLTPAQSSALAPSSATRDAGREPPSVSEISAQFGAGAGDLLRLAAARGDVAASRCQSVLCGISPRPDYHRARRSLFAGRRGGADRGSRGTRLSRKFVIPLLEYADRAGLTRRRATGGSGWDRPPGAGPRPSPIERPARRRSRIRVLTPPCLGRPPDRQWPATLAQRGAAHSRRYGGFAGHRDCNEIA